MVWRTMLICLFLLLSVGFTGAQNNSQLKFVVRIDVAAADDIKDEATSYLKRELRDFEDVIIDDLLHGYVLSVLILEPTYKSSGSKTGNIECAYLGIKRFPFGDLMSKLPKEQHNTVFDATRRLYFYPELFGLQTGWKRTQLKQLCQKIVAEFDTDLLEPYR